jgi:hypothetical protein
MCAMDDQRAASAFPIRPVLLAFTVIGFVVPNAMVVTYFARHGFDNQGYFQAWFDSLPAAQITIDAILTATAFSIWALWDSARHAIRLGWLVIPASVLVGICFGLPLYLLLRERSLSDAV